MQNVLWVFMYSFCKVSMGAMPRNHINCRQQREEIRLDKRWRHLADQIDFICNVCIIIFNEILKINHCWFNVSIYVCQVFFNGIQPFDMYFLLRHISWIFANRLLDSPEQLGHYSEFSTVSPFVVSLIFHQIYCKLWVFNVLITNIYSPYWNV